MSTATMDLLPRVQEASKRLKAGDKPADVPCPKCQQERYVATETVGGAPYAACSCCGFQWFIA